jgi:hypothetical protein
MEGGRIQGGAAAIAPRNSVDEAARPAAAMRLAPDAGSSSARRFRPDTRVQLRELRAGVTFVSSHVSRFSS